MKKYYECYATKVEFFMGKNYEISHNFKVSYGYFRLPHARRITV